MHDKIIHVVFNTTALTILISNKPIKSISPMVGISLEFTKYECSALREITHFGKINSHLATVFNKIIQNSEIRG